VPRLMHLQCAASLHLVNPPHSLALVA